MSNKIQVIQDKAGNNVFPITHEKAVRDSAGVSLDAKFSALESKTYIEAWDGASTPVVANIPAGVVVSYNGTNYTGTLAASSSTDGKIYLVKDGTEYDRYVSNINLGGTYMWSYLGTTAMSLTGYVTKPVFDALDDEINGYETEQKVAIDLSSLSVVYRFINSSNKWAATNNPRCVFVPITPGKKYEVKYTAAAASLAVLKDDSHTASETPNWATGFVGRIAISANEAYTFTAPEDGSYLYVLLEYNGSSFNPQVWSYETVGVDGVVSRVEKLENDTEELSETISEMQQAGARKFVKIHPITSIGELRGASIETVPSGEYVDFPLEKFRGETIFVHNEHSATGHSVMYDADDEVIASFDGTTVGLLVVPDDAAHIIISNAFGSARNPDFYIEVPESLAGDNSLLFNANFVRDYDHGDFSQFNGTIVQGKGLSLVTGAANGLIVGKAIAIDNWTLVADVLTQDNQETVNLGTKITQASAANHSTRFEVNFSTGAISLYNNASGTLAATASAAAIIDGYIYTLKLERINRNIKGTLVNKKTGQSVSVESLDGAEGSGNEGINMAGKMFDSPIFYVGSGSPYLQDFYATCARNIRALFVGDSLTQGAHTTWETSWAPMAAEYFGNSLSAGRGSGTVFECLNQLRSLLPVTRPKVVIVTIGTNYDSGISDAGYGGLYIGIMSIIREYGAIPVVNFIPACNSRKTNIAKLNAIIEALNPIGCRFDLATSLNNTWADGQDTQYYYTDNVHLNVAGNTLLYNIITSQMGWIKDL